MDESSVHSLYSCNEAFDAGFFADGQWSKFSIKRTGTSETQT